MEGRQSAAVVDYVGKAVASLETLSEAMTRCQGGDSEGLHASVATVEETTKQLHSTVNDLSKQRVLMLSSDQLMEAGIVLYNTARATFKCYQATAKSGDCQGIEGVRFPVLFVRLMAAHVMELGLSCSNGGKQEFGSSASDQSVFVDDCLDVLRSYGRVGSLLLENASIESGKCSEYLTLAKEALDHASIIWGRLGLSCLTRFKEGIELEEILQDLWDFCVDRIRASRSLRAYANDGMAVAAVIETLHELMMLLPFMSSSSMCLLELVQDLVDDWSHSDRHADLVALVEEALRLCDTLDGRQDTIDIPISHYKRGFLVRLLHSLGCLGEVEKADACFSLLGCDKPPTAILTMIKLYLQQRLGEKAKAALKQLFQHDDVASSIAGARMFLEANDFSEESIEVYRQLEHHYGDHALEIGVELACALALSESPHQRANAIFELKRISEVVETLPRDNRSNYERQVVRIRQTVKDTATSALNERASEVNLDDPNGEVVLGDVHRSCQLLKKKRLRSNESMRWAEEAMNLDSSKVSLLSMFEAALGLADQNNSSASLKIFWRLKGRDDFELQDLVAYGHAAHISGQEDVCLLVMDDMCRILSKGQATIEELPFGLLLQNTAQLALSISTRNTTAGGGSVTPTSHVEKFVEYAEMFLQVAEKLCLTDFEHFAPQSALVWFYSMSFNIARNCSHRTLFICAADFAKQGMRLFGLESPVTGREFECLLAALSSDMADFEMLDPKGLKNTLDLVTRIRTLFEKPSEHDSFVEKCELALRLRMYDTDIEAIRNLCQGMSSRDVNSYVEVGELILQAARFDEAMQMRKAYRSLARDLFKHGLQRLLQGDHIEPAKLSYLFRRLVTLSESHKEAFDWFDQLVQLSASVSIELPQLDAEWFIAKAWNMGVQNHRRKLFDESQKFMKVALALLASIGANLKDLTEDLHHQYQEFGAPHGNAMLTVD